MATLASVCPLDCPDRCSLDVVVDDGRVTRIGGSDRNPITADFICGKVARFGERLVGPDRLRQPLRRRGRKGTGDFVPISWDEAVAEITDRLASIAATSGGEAILPYCYGGSNGLLSHGLYDERYFRLLGASRLLRTVCAAPTGFAARTLYGKMAGVDFRDYPEARLIVIWGANPAASNIHLVPYLKEAKKRGATIVQIDPRRTLAFVDRHLAVRPGSDLLLALALIGELERIGAVDHEFLAQHADGHERLLARAREVSLADAERESGVARADLVWLAQAWKDARPAVIRCGWGPERNRNGEGAIASILAIPALTGKFGVRGGGYTLSNSGAYRVDAEKAVAFASPPARAINMNHLGRVLLEERHPRIEALFVWDANPVATVPDQNRILAGLAREDLFTVVFDQVLTDSAVWADIVLPATTFLEHRELSTSYGAFAVQYAEPVVAPVGESRSNEAVFRELGTAMANRLGRGAELFHESGAVEKLLAAIAGPLPGRDDAQALAARLRTERFVALDFPGDRPLPFSTSGPLTADGKVHLYPEDVGESLYRYRELSAAFPLALISPSSGAMISSTFGERELQAAVLDVHPDDATVRGLADGAAIRVWNELGEVHCRLRLSRSIRPGVVSLPKGLWNRATSNGRVSTALVPDAVTELSGGACFNDARVEIASAS